jgi:hypothetical protein
MRNKKTTWRELLTAAAGANGEEMEVLSYVGPPGFDLDREFDAGYGGQEGDPFTAWGPNWVYFPICYDGSEWVGSAPRRPCGYISRHQGG